MSDNPFQPVFKNPRVGEVSFDEGQHTSVDGMIIPSCHVDPVETKATVSPLDCDFATLCRVAVQITDIYGTQVKVVSALEDSGAEISLVHSDVVKDLELPRCGKLKIRSVVGNRIDTDLVHLRVTLAEPAAAEHQSQHYCNILCAVCPSLDSEEMILTGEVVQFLRDSVTSVNVVTRTGSDTHHDPPGDSVTEDDDESPPPFDDDRDVGQLDIQSLPSDMTDLSNSDSRKANAETLRQEQLADESLKGWWGLANKQKGNFVVQDGLLHHKEKILGQEFSQLCLPKDRRLQVLNLAHDTFGGHLGAKRTRDRIRLSFTWPTLTSDCKRYCQTCESCQKRALKR